MTLVLIGIAALVAGLVAGHFWARHPFVSPSQRTPPAKSILLPFAGGSISKRSFKPQCASPRRRTL